MGRRNNRNRRSNDKSNPPTPNPTGSETQTTTTDSTSSANKNNVEQPTPEEKDKAKNDVAWYDVIPGLLNAAASVPYSYPQGAVYDANTGKGIATTAVIRPQHGEKRALPGICTLTMKSSFGRSFNMNDPANVCATAAYTHVRFMNSGRKNYDPADLFMYYGAIAELTGFIEWCKRLYNYAFTYSQKNYYIGKALIRANKVDESVLYGNLANFRYWLNAFISKVSAFAIPADIAVFKRKAFMYASYYLENPYSNIKDQLYQFAPDGFYRFQYDGANAGMLAYVPFTSFLNSSGLLTFDALREYAEYLLQHIYGDEDFGLMSGDVLKAYQGNIIVNSVLAEEGGIAPVYDPYVLSQFKNATVCPNILRSTEAYNDPLRYKDIYVSGEVYQDTNGNIIAFDAVWPEPAGARKSAGALLVSKVLSLEVPEPTPGDTIEASRLTLSCDTVTNVMPDWNADRTLIISGDFIAVLCTTDTIVQESNSAVPAIQSISHYSMDYTNEDTWQPGETLELNMFKYAPVKYLATAEESPDYDELTNIRVASNVDNFTFLSKDNIKTMHECALLSMYYVPGIAKMIQ